MVVHAEQSEIEASIKAETDRLLKIRSKVLNDKITPIENKLEQLAFREENLKNRCIELESEISDKELIISGLNDHILSKNADITILESTVKDLKDSITVLESKKTALQVDIDPIIERLSQLQQQEQPLIDRITTLEEKKSSLINKISEIDNQYTLKISDKESELMTLDVKLLKTKQDMLSIQNILDAEKKSLADRKLELDDRDKNLRIREQKANIQENTIRQNANLLDL